MAHKRSSDRSLEAMHTGQPAGGEDVQARRKPMIRVRFATVHAAWPWRRQFPGGNPVWGDCRFLFEDDGAPYDYLVVYDAIDAPIAVACDPSRTMLVAAEPVNVKRYDASFAMQFGMLLTTDRDSSHPNRILTQAGLPWHVGVNHHAADMAGTAFDFHRLEALADSPKPREISVICSNKAFTPEHAKRLAFAQRLKAHFGDRLDMFGRGFNEIADKAEALVPYRYHIALENCDFQDYWTEKIADPFLAGCLPIYWGCRNITDYFATDALIPIDIDQPDAAITTIEQALETDQFSRRRDAVLAARDRVMSEHNLFALLARLIEDHADRHPSPTTQAAMLWPEASFHRGAPARGLKNAVRYALRDRPRLLAAAKRGYQLRLLPGKWANAADAWRQEQVTHWRRVINEPAYPHHDRWLAAHGDTTLRLDYPLAPEDIVLDIGGYRGDWAAAINERYGCTVFVFEPVPEFCAELHRRFAGNSRIRVFDFGLADRDGEIEMAISGDATSAFRTGEGSHALPVRAITGFLKEHGIDRVRLAKINIEGGEYPLLESLAADGAIASFDHIQIQFHDFVEDAVRRRRRLRRRLRATHRPSWTFPFVWESWERRRSRRGDAS